MPKFEKERTAVLLIDPYNDFISEGGKIWPRIKHVAEANNCVPHMSQVGRRDFASSMRCTTATVRAITRPGTTLHRSRRQRRIVRPQRVQAEPIDITAQERWGSSGFANTDLDLLLKKHGIHRIVVVGLIARACVGSTVPFAA